ncbi:HAD family hydrolase [Aurantimonas sp. A2-1-M11]|uniref:HAD family hydrolase n=1 Tax=Aurantimonas sp. A2-1-M11 TaxID=3113712 RepID=UPI002F921B17
MCTARSARVATTSCPHFSTRTLSSSTVRRSRPHAAASTGKATPVRWSPFADVAALFTRVRQDDWTIVIAISGQSEEVDPHLEKLGVRELVDAVTTAGDAERTKPDPDIFAAALRKVGAEAANAIVVGDSPYDITAATKLGIRTIAVRSGGFEDRTLMEAGAVAIYDNPADLLARYDASLLASG